MLFSLFVVVVSCLKSDLTGAVVRFACHKVFGCVNLHCHRHSLLRCDYFVECLTETSGLLLFFSIAIVLMAKTLAGEQLRDRLSRMLLLPHENAEPMRIRRYRVGQVSRLLMVVTC
jgi:hypothetical protein